MSAAWLVAAVAAGCAVALLVPAAPQPPGARPLPAPVRHLVLLALVGALALVTAPELLPAAFLAGMVPVGATLLWRRRGARFEEAATAARLVEVCEALAGELAAGQPPVSALRRAAEEWSLLRPAAEAARVGSDVPGALRRAARAPGAEALRWVAAAWQVAHRTGQALAGPIDRVAVELREQQATRRVVEGELASARATAKLVALLPLAALAMGSGVGGDPWSFLLGTPVGLGCLAAGLLCGWAGLWWIEAIARSVGRAS